ncbi:MAG: hypothetical protein JNL08_16420 [Planctomycetes bacterium]|nr:hypothetical protein [Planctomycetota bacterium]
MPSPRRWPTATCLALATAVYGAGAVFVWQKHGGLRTWQDVVVVAAAGAAALALLAGWWRVWRRPPPPGFGLRCAFVAAVLLWFGYALLAGDYRRGRVGIAGVAFAALVGAAVARAPAAARRPSRPALLLLAVALLLLVGETALRTLRWLAPGPLWAARSAQVEERLRVHAFAPGGDHFGFRTNADGCVDAPFEPPGPQRGPVLAVVGDSFSAGVVPHAYHYTTVAERELDGTAVWNVGWAGLGPAEYHHLLTTVVLPRRPDAVLVALFLGNDLAETPPWSGLDRVLADWFDRGNVLLCEVPRRIARLLGPGVDAGLVRLGNLAAAEPWLHDPAREPGTFTEAAFLELELARARVACDPAPRLPALLAELRAMQARCADVPFALLLIPDECMVEDALWGRLAAAWPAGAAPPQRWGLRDRLVAFCAEAGLPCLDLTEVLRKEAPLADGDRHLYLRRDTHWNVRGNAAAGAALVPFARALLARRGGR